jgi:hypothetical protein
MLYHYTSIGRAAAIALTGSILLSPLEFLNDPRESQRRSTIRVTYGTSPLPNADEDLAELHEHRLLEFRGGVRVGCYTRDERLERGTLADADARGFARPRCGRSTRTLTVAAV